MSNKIVMTSEELKQKLLNIVNRETTYCNKYPKNLCYYDGEYLSADCWNLIKSLIWDPTIDNNYEVGKFAKPDFSTGLGDWNANQIIEACEEVSEDFSDISKIPVGAFLYYYNGKHAGAYIGNNQVVESTTAWDRCVQITNIDTVVYQGDIVGKRSKNGEWKGYWTKWAKLPWIDYSEPKCKTWNKGDKVTLKKGSKIYGKTSCYASWVYNAILTVVENSKGDRAVIGNDSIPCIGPVYSNDLEPYIEPEVILPPEIDINTFKFLINLETTIGGKVVIKTEAIKGEEVEILIYPEENYKLKELTSNQVLITNNKFTMPANDVTINVVFEKQKTWVEELIELLVKLLKLIFKKGE